MLEKVSDPQRLNVCKRVQVENQVFHSEKTVFEEDKPGGMESRNCVFAESTKRLFLNQSIRTASVPRAGVLCFVLDAWCWLVVEKAVSGFVPETQSCCLFT